MHIKRKMRAVKNVILLSAMFIILLIIMVMFQEYSTQFPLKITLTVMLTQYILFRVLVRRIRLNILFDKKYILKDEQIKLCIKTYKRSIYPFKKIDVTIRYKSKYKTDEVRKVVNIELSDKMNQRKDIIISDLPCGYTEFTIEKAYVYDVFGFGSVALKGKCEPVNLIVIPSPKPIDIDLPKAAYISGDESEIFLEDSGKDSSELFMIREFHDGDSMNRIHWKLSSKTEELMIRDSVSSIDTNIYVFFDLCRSAELDEKFEKAVSTAYELRSLGYAFYLVWMDSYTHILKRSLVSEYEHIERTVADIMGCELYEKDDDVVRRLDRFMNENHEVYNLFILS